ncbi:MAG TPA: citrate transporter [Ignavibacteriaceae bacterium]|nr:citrate transporter [Ignavibacteriaceae bacterium]
MEILQVVLLFLVFLTSAVSMFLRKIPALIALPLMAFFIPVIAGVSINDTIQFVLGAGAIRLSEAYTIAIFGSMLSVLLQKTGIAESFIKIGAELSGDKPWTIALLMLILISLLFTTLGGLGAIIMVATVVLPIMASAGIGSVTTAGIFLIGLSLGGIFNVGNWAVYISILGLKIEEVRSFAFIIFGITFVVGLLYITIMLYRDGHDIDFKKIIIRSLIFGIIISALLYFYYTLSTDIKNNIFFMLGKIGSIFKWIIAAAIILLFIASTFRASLNKNENGLHWISYFTPFIPLFLILIFNMNFIASFIVGLLYGFISTYKKRSLNVFVKSMLEGGSVVMPAVALMLGIGMLLNAVIGPPTSGYSATALFNDVGKAEILLPKDFRTADNAKNLLLKFQDQKDIKTEFKNDSLIIISGIQAKDIKYEVKYWPVLNILKPVFKNIIPDNPISYIIIFFLLAPLALYRGPLNVWGMGFGMAAIFLASGMPAGAIMGLLLSVGQIQGISDPTNTQNVWLANEVRVDVQKILWNTIPYTWLVALLGLTASAIMFM